MHFPRAYYQMHDQLAEHFPHLRPAQHRGLALWVCGTLLAKSGCQNAVIAAFLLYGRFGTIRDSLREWLYDGKDKAAPCRTQVEVSWCFAPLLRWVLSLWQGNRLTLAVDVTYKSDLLIVLAVAVLYRGCAIPVAWTILPGYQRGAWMPQLCALLQQLQPAVPPAMEVLVLTDEGLCSPVLYWTVRRLGWHPLERIHPTSTFCPAGQRQRHPATSFVTTPGQAWIGAGVAFASNKVPGTLMVVWAKDEAVPWVLLTDLGPTQVGVWWYALRYWVELGFRALKGVGWRWEHTRRTDPDRAARHWLVLAVAMLWVLAHGTRAEDAELRGMLPHQLHGLRSCPVPARTGQRTISLFLRGWSLASHLLHRGVCWKCLWLAPDPWPGPPPGLTITIHSPFALPYAESEAVKHSYPPL